MLRLLLALVLCAGLAGTAAAADTCPPNLMIILDRSGSMSATPDGQSAGTGRPSRWSLATQAIKRLLDRYGAQISVGLSLFPSDASCGPARVNIPTGSVTRDAILARLAATSPDGNTPTAASVAAIAAASPQRDTRRQQFILLLTDGSPNCTTSPVDATVDAITQANLATPPIKTFVVGFGALLPAEQLALNRMALAGGVPDSDPQYKYYRADNDTALNQALDRIIAQIPPPPPPPPPADLGMSPGTDAGAGQPGYGTPIPDLGVPDASSVYQPTNACDPPPTGDTLPDGGTTTLPGSGQIDTSCYLYPCPDPAHVCIRGVCRPSPCAGVTCPRGQYCYTNGMEKGVCHAVCPMSCPEGTRCSGGRCALASPCPDDCIPGGVCNWGTKTCSPEPLCLGVTCPAPLICYRGACIEDPCDRLVFCPAGTRCVRWFGACEALPPPGSDGGAAAADLGAAAPDAGALRRSKPLGDGCSSAGPGGGGGGGGGADRPWAGLLLGVFFLRRRVRMRPR